MTTHPRAWMLRAGVVMALATGSLAILPQPAMAADPSIEVVSLSNGSLRSEEEADLRIRVTLADVDRGNETSVRVVCTPAGAVECVGGRDATKPFDTNTGRAEFDIKLRARKLEPGQTQSGTVQIEASLTNGRGTARLRPPVNINVSGPDAEPSATQVSGKVLDADTSEPVANAMVAMTDKAGRQWNTQTNNNGSYKFVATRDKPIAPGRIDIGAAIDGYEREITSATAVAGKPLSIRLLMQSNAPPSPTASPTPSASASVEPTADASADALAAVPPPAATNPTAASDGGNSWTLILLGGLLVAAGIGAIVLVLLRRKDSDAEAADDDIPDAAVPAVAVPASQGVYRGLPDATQVAGARSGPADATMVAGGGIPASLANAPTMLQRAVPADDEFPDPYGAPLPPQQAPTYGAGAPGGAATGVWGTPGYAGAAGAAGVTGAAAAPGYAGAVGAAGAAGVAGAVGAGAANSPYQQPSVPGQPGGGYGSPGGYGGPPAQRQEQYGAHEYPPPSEPTGYPPAQGGYGQQYDEPTGRYEPPAGGYPAQNRQPDGPGAAAGGYQPQAGYPAAGYQPGADSDYRQPAPGGAYGQPPPGGDYGHGGASPDYGQQPQSGGYGQPAPHTYPAGGQYGDQPARGYEAGPAGYGPQAGGGYQPGAGQPAGGGYGAPADHAASGYSANGPDQANGYGPANGHDPANGYGAANGYDAAGGYDPRGGYDRGGQPGGYDRGGQYSSDPAQPPSRHGASGPPPGQPPVGEQRRPLDWLDD